MELAGRTIVSCSHIGQALNLDPTQIRKDLAVTGIVGKPKVGYDLQSLLESIEAFLGWNNVTDAFLVGAGSLGTALLGYQQFNTYGLSIVAAFDNDPEKIGHTVHGKEVLPIEKLPDLAQRMHVTVGIITVPADAAQGVADVMVLGGLRGLWNLAPTPLSVPDGVIVQNDDLFSSLAVLFNRLETCLKATPDY
jgi:redox-sensing transcriptional repressor